MNIEDALINILKDSPAGTFLFVGSGFSRRYLGLEDWRGLLDRFCKAGKPFEYYLAKANGDYPTVAKLLAEDFNEYWWHAKEYEKNVEIHRNKVIDVTSALRIEICNYLSGLDQTKARSSEFANEIEILSNLNVDGIITTNWDVFLEQLFPDYRTYIGQEEILFSNPQEIGEIYKIHGCSTKPSSLVLTSDDYKTFNEKNTYLAAKLITLFVEHPIIFIGYSISDKNISSLLKAISSCIGKNNIERLRKNLIFVQRVEQHGKPGISETFLSIDGIQIPLVLVKTNDFSCIYKAIDTTKRKIPARILRYCKEQLYEIVQSSQPEDKICLVDIDEIETKDDVEFLVGIGVASQRADSPTSIGYAPICLTDLIDDVLHDNRNYDPHQIVENVLSRLIKNTPNVPVFKYLLSLGIDSQEKYKKSTFKLDKVVNRQLKDFKIAQYSKGYFKYRHNSMEDIINDCTPENVAAYIPHINKEKINLNLLRDFLIQHQTKIDSNVSPYASHFRKLAALYDKLKWGW